MNTLRVMPTLDQFEARRWSSEVEEQRDAYAAEQFVADTPQFYRSPRNRDLLLGWLTERGVPITLRNLTVAFRVLLADGALESRPTVEAQPEPPDNSWGVQKMTSTVKLHHTCPDTPLNRQLLAEEILGRYSWCPIGVDPKKTELGRQYKVSIREEATAKGRPAGWLDARAKVAMEHANLKRDSVEFNRLVAVELEKS
ncbi:MAG: hypothetical protein WA735_09035 [Candidatus Acidiferrales bacterium]